MSNRNYLTILIITFPIILFGQEFSFPMYFEDAKGNRDTMVLGYDENATDSIDTEFEEVNIISHPLKTNLDVRTNNIIYLSSHRPDSSILFQLKKQILKKIPKWPICGTGILHIEIKCKNWPVTARWDNTLFKDTCNQGTIFTGLHPGLWWDVGTESCLHRAELTNQNEVSFNKNYDQRVRKEEAYINSNGDTISFFWFTFHDVWLITDTEEPILKNSIIVFPNPGSDLIQFRIPQELSLRKIEIYNSLGQKMKDFPVYDEYFDVNEYETGIYWILFYFKDSRITIKKLQILR